MAPIARAVGGKLVADRLRANQGQADPASARQNELSLTAADFETDPARKSPKHVLEQLVAAAPGGEGVSQKATPVELQGSGNQRATLSFGKKSVSVKITNLSPKKHAVLEQAIRTLIG